MRTLKNIFIVVVCTLMMVLFPQNIHADWIFVGEAPTLVSDFTYDSTVHQLINIDPSYKPYEEGKTGSVVYSCNGASFGGFSSGVSHAGTYTYSYEAYLDSVLVHSDVIGTVTIAKAQNQITQNAVAATGLEFNGSPQSLLTTPAKAFIGDVEGVEYNVNGVNKGKGIPKATNAGTYTIVYSTLPDAEGNYESVSSSTTSIIIDPKPITASFTAKNLTYNGTSQNTSVLSITPTGAIAGADVEYETVSGQAGTNAGTYTLKIKGINNYNFQSETNWTIDKLDITGGSATLAEEVLLYSGNPQTASVTSITKDSATLYPSDFTVTDATQTNVGAYTLTVSGKDPNTFGSLTKQFKIDPLVLSNETVDVVLGPSLTYNGSEQTQTVAKVVIKSTGAVLNPSEYTVTNDKGTNAGNYTLTVTGNGGNVTGSVTKDFTIAKCPVTGTWTGGPTFTYDGSTKTVYLTNLPSCASASYSGNSASDYGNYTARATITITGNDNYVAGSVPNYNWSIERPSYDMSGVKFVSKSFGFDGKPHSIEITGKLPQGVTVKYLNNTRTNIGAQKATAVFTGDKYHAPIENMYAEIKIVNKLVDIPEQLENPVLEDGSEKFLFNEGEGYIVEGDGHTEPGRYQVTLKLKDAKNTAWSDGTSEDKVYEFVIKRKQIVDGKNTITDDKNGFDPDAKLVIKYTEKKDNSDYKHIVDIDGLLSGHQAFNFGYLVDVQVDNKSVGLNGETVLVLSIPEKFVGQDFELTYAHLDLVEKGYAYELSKDGKSITVKVNDLVGEFVFANTDFGSHVHINKILTILACILFTVIYNMILKHHKLNVLVVLVTVALVGVYLYIGSFKNCDTCLTLDIVAAISLLFMLYRFLKKYKDDDKQEETNEDENKEETTEDNTVEDNNEDNK